MADMAELVMPPQTDTAVQKVPTPPGSTLGSNQSTPQGGTAEVDQRGPLASSGVDGQVGSHGSEVQATRENSGPERLNRSDSGATLSSEAPESDTASSGEETLSLEMVKALAIQRANFKEPASPTAFDDASAKQEPVRVAPGASLLPGERKSVFERLYDEHVVKMQRLEQAQGEKLEEELKERMQHLTFLESHFQQAPLDDIQRISRKLHADYNLLQVHLDKKRKKLQASVDRLANRACPRFTEEELIDGHKGVELYKIAYDAEAKQMKRTKALEDRQNEMVRKEFDKMQKLSVHRRAREAAATEGAEEIVGGCCQRLFNDAKKRENASKASREKKEKQEQAEVEKTSRHKEVPKGAWRPVVRRLYGGWKTRAELMDQLTSRARPRCERLRKFGVNTGCGTERFNMLYGDAFRRAEDRKMEMERQEFAFQRKNVVGSVHAAAQLRSWTRQEVDEVASRMHAPRKSHTTWQAIRTPVGKKPGDKSLGEHSDDSDMGSDAAWFARVSPQRQPRRPTSQPTPARAVTFGDEPAQKAWDFNLKMTAAAAWKAVQEIQATLTAETRPASASDSGSEEDPETGDVEICSCGAVLGPDFQFCRRCGKRRPEELNGAAVVQVSNNRCASPGARLDALGATTDAPVEPSFVRMIDNDSNGEEYASGSESELSEPRLSPNEVSRMVEAVRSPIGLEGRQSSSSSSLFASMHGGARHGRFKKTTRAIAVSLAASGSAPDIHRDSHRDSDVSDGRRPRTGEFARSSSVPSGRSTLRLGSTTKTQPKANVHGVSSSGSAPSRGQVSGAGKAVAKRSSGAARYSRDRR